MSELDTLRARYAKARALRDLRKRQLHDAETALTIVTDELMFALELVAADN